MCSSRALAGLGAPHWRPEARGLLMGLDRSSHLGHVARAVLEGIGLQTYELARAMAEDSKQSLPVAEGRRRGEAPMTS